VAQHLVGVAGDVVDAALGAVVFGEAASCPSAFVPGKSSPDAQALAVEDRPLSALLEYRTAGADRLRFVKVFATPREEDVGVASSARCVLLPIHIP
jgi:hypothetical protein